MGNTKSRYEVIDYAVNKNLSSKYDISEWVDLETPTKNHNYYFSKQSITKIPIHFYPQYSTGYLYGHYETPYEDIESYELVL